MKFQCAAGPEPHASGASGSPADRRPQAPRFAARASHPRRAATCRVRGCGLAHRRGPAFPTRLPRTAQLHDPSAIAALRRGTISAGLRAGNGRQTLDAPQRAADARSSYAAKEDAMQFGKYAAVPRTGGDLRLADYHDPGDTGGLDLEKRGASSGERWSCSPTCRRASTPTTVGRPRRLPGDGRGGQGQRHQARHVGVNPQGCEVHPFKVPTAHEIDHDFRASVRLPARGHIGIFNRSYYEEVAVRVHPEILDRQKLPPARRQPHLRGAARGHPQLRALSRPQRAADRLLPQRLPTNRSAASGADRQPREALEVRAGRHRGAQALERLHGGLRGRDPRDRHARCTWYVVPADKKWFTRLVVAGAIIERLAQLGLEYPGTARPPCSRWRRRARRCCRNVEPRATTREARCEVRTPRMRRAVVPVARAAGAGTRRACRGSRRSPDPLGCRCRRARPQGRSACLDRLGDGVADALPARARDRRRRGDDHQLGPDHGDGDDVVDLAARADR